MEGHPGMMNSGSEPPVPSEFELIARLFAPLATSSDALGLRDDAALITPPDNSELVVTADALVEGVHFFRADPADRIAKKALRVNLSDLAGKGAIPHGYLLVLSIPQWVDFHWLTRFSEGLRVDQERFQLSLLGGDTTATPGPLTIAITAIGTVGRGRMVSRSGARPGDDVFVTGTIGDAGAGLACLQGLCGKLSRSERQMLIDRYQVPEPRTSLGKVLPGVVSAALDISDGLIADIGHLASASNVRVEVHASKVPISEPVGHLWQDRREAWFRALTAGDDYEIAFTAPRTNHNAVGKLAAELGVSVSRIGRVLSGEGVFLLDEMGIEIPVQQKGYVHF